MCMEIQLFDCFNNEKAFSGSCNGGCCKSSMTYSTSCILLQLGKTLSFSEICIRLLPDACNEFTILGYCGCCAGTKYVTDVRVAYNLMCF